MTDEETKPAKKRNPRHEIFKDAYLKCWNATDAYQVAYPKVNRDTARANGAKLLADTSIKAAIDARIAESHMSADEALKLQADIARGDIGALLDNNGLLDIRQAKELGMTRLLRKIKQKTITHIGKSETDGDTEITEIEFEMYDAQTAQRDILKIHGKFVDRTDVTSGGEKIEVVIRYADEKPDSKPTEAAQ